jgi:hypothetical protein
MSKTLPQAACPTASRAVAAAVVAMPQVSCIPDNFVNDSANSTRNKHTNLENSLAVDLDAPAASTTTTRTALPRQFVLKPKRSSKTSATATLLLENHLSSMPQVQTLPSESIFLSSKSGEQQEEDSSLCHHDHASNDDDDDDNDKEVEFFSLLQPLHQREQGLHSPPPSPSRPLLPLIPLSDTWSPAHYHHHTIRPHHHQHSSGNSPLCTVSTTFLPPFRPCSSSNLPRDLTEMF